MALIRCPECGEKISDKSDVCVHCGFPVNKKNVIVINGIEFPCDEIAQAIDNYKNNKINKKKRGPK